MFQTNFRPLARQVLTLVAGLGAAAAMAQVPASSLQLTFTQPSGIVGPTDAVPVYLTLTNNDATQAFTYDNTLPDGGLDASLLPAQGSGTDSNGNSFTAPFASYSNVFLGFAFGCSGSFTAVCTQGPPYNFTFVPSPFTSPYSLAAGASASYLFGTFAPSAGPVAAGTYEFYRGVLYSQANGLDAAGNQISGFAFNVNTCQFDTAAQCAGSIFSRTVTAAVPEPSNVALLAAGLGVVGWSARRRRSQRA